MLPAKSLIVASLLLAVGLVAGQEEALGPNGQPRPEPYSFSYSADASGSLSSHQESGDGTGRITGVYTIAGPDGRERRVEYVADSDGYRATIKTNEMGTKPGDSADARWQVEQPSDAQLAAANNANALNAQRVLSSANSRPQQPQQPNQQAEGSDGNGRQAGQQQEQIPSAANQNPAIASASDETQQQQTLVNLDEIPDQPPAAPIPQLINPQQQQVILQQPQLVQGPLPQLTFQARAPQPVQQQQVTQIREQQQQNIQPPNNIQAIKGQQIEVGPLPVAPEQPQQPQQVINQNLETKFGPRVPVQPVIQAPIGPVEPVQIIEQAPPQQQQLITVEQPQQQQVIRVDQPQQQLIRLEQPQQQPILPQQPIALPVPSFQPIQPGQPIQPVIQEAPQPIRVVEQQQVKGNNIVGPIGGNENTKTVEVSREQQQVIQAPQQPQILQRVEQAPAFVPQQQIVQQFQPQPQPQLIQVPLEPEIAVPVFQSERIQPLRQPQLINTQPQLVQVNAGARLSPQQPQQQIGLLPNEPLRLQPIFGQLAVKGQEQQQQQLQPIQPQPVPVQPQQPASKGQVEIVTLKQEEQSGGQAADEKANEANNDQDDNDEQEADAKAPAGNAGANQAGQLTTVVNTAAPIITTAQPIVTTTIGQQLPAGRLVFGTKNGARLAGVKTGTKAAAPAPAAPIQPQIQLAAPAPIAGPAPIAPPALIAAPAPNRFLALPQQQQQPAPQQPIGLGPNQRFIPFGSRLGTKANSLGVKSAGPAS